jgi:hypothetical protein
MCDFLLLACVWLSGCLKVCPVVLLRLVPRLCGHLFRQCDHVINVINVVIWENGFVEPMGTHAPCAERGS